MRARRLVRACLAAGLAAGFCSLVGSGAADASDLGHDPLAEMRSGASLQLDLLDLVELDPALDRTFTVAPATEHGSATLDGSVLTYTPDPGFAGVDQVSVTDHQPSATSTFGLTVAVKDQPVVAADDFTLFDVGTQRVLDVGANDSTTSGGPLRFTLYQATGGSAACDGSSCTFTPAAGSRAGTVQYDAWDDATGEHDTGIWRLLARDRAPVAVADAVVVHRGQTTYFAPLANDSDPDGDVLALDPALGPPDCQGDGTCALSAATDEQWTEPHELTYSATDGLLHATGHITATMPGDDNAAPDSQGAQATAIGTRRTYVTPAASDPNGDPISWTPVDQPVMGTLSHDADGWWYTADTNADGTDGFTMRVADDHGGTTDVPVDIARTAYAVPDFEPAWQQPTLVYRGEQVGALGPCTSDHDVYGTDPPVTLQSDDGSGWVSRTLLTQGSVAGHCVLGGAYRAGTSGRFDLRLRVGPRWGAAPRFTPTRTVKVALAGIPAVDPVGAESVTVRNNGAVSFNLGAFTLTSRPDPYHGTGDRGADLPSYTLRPGRTVVLHTGSGTSTSSDLYLGTGRMLPDAGGTVRVVLRGHGPTARW